MDKEDDLPAAPGPGAIPGLPPGIRGVNLIGYASRNFGLSVSTRHIAQVLMRRGIDVRVFDLTDAPTVQGHDGSLDAHGVLQMEALPHEVNLFCLNVMAMPRLLLRLRESDLQWSRRLNVAVLFWELPILPPHWLPAVGAFDAVLCSSWFIRETVAWQLPGTVPLHLTYPLALPEIPARKRSDFGVPDGVFAFYFSFDPYSGVDRKNPRAVLRAFQRAFSGAEAPRAHLVLKLNAPSPDAPGLSPASREFVDECRAMPNVTVIARSLAYDEAMALCQTCCDCYVSLHRSEGLGMGPMEAMLMGKPVIMTAWSGNMSYAPLDTFCPVPYRLIQPDGFDSPQFATAFLRARTRWADASVKTAAWWMRRLVEEPALRAQIAARGQAHMRRYAEQAAQCQFVDELAPLLELKKAHGPNVPTLEESQRRIGAAQRAHMGLHAQRLRKLLSNNVPGMWSLFRRLGRPRGADVLH